MMRGKGGKNLREEKERERKRERERMREREKEGERTGNEIELRSIHTITHPELLPERLIA